MLGRCRLNNQPKMPTLALSSLGYLTVQREQTADVCCLSVGDGTRCFFLYEKSDSRVGYNIARGTHLGFAIQVERHKKTASIIIHWHCGAVPHGDDCLSALGPPWLPTQLLVLAGDL